MSILLHTNTPLLLEDLVNEMFQTCTVEQVRNVYCQTSGSEIILRGSVTSFDLKRLAQSMAKTACGMRDIANEIVVTSEGTDGLTG